MRSLVLDRAKSLAARDRMAKEAFPAYKAIDVPQDIDGLSDTALFALYESLLERRVSIDSQPQI